MARNNLRVVSVSVNKRVLIRKAKKLPREKDFIITSGPIIVGRKRKKKVKGFALNVRSNK